MLTVRCDDYGKPRAGQGRHDWPDARKLDRHDGESLVRATSPTRQPEKWDSVTRRKSQASRVASRLALMMIDEVRWLDQGGRYGLPPGGSALTYTGSLPSRFARSISRGGCTPHEDQGHQCPLRCSQCHRRSRPARFADVKVPNIDDIARWFGQPSETVETGVYEGGTDQTGPEYDYKQQLDYKLMRKAKVYKVRDIAVIQSEALTRRSSGTSSVPSSSRGLR